MLEIKSCGDFIIPIKENRKNLYDDLLLYFDDKRCEEIIAGNTQSGYYTENEKSHASFIKYGYFQTLDMNWYSKLLDWKTYLVSV